MDRPHEECGGQVSTGVVPDAEFFSSVRWVCHPEGWWVNAEGGGRGGGGAEQRRKSPIVVTNVVLASRHGDAQPDGGGERRPAGPACSLERLRVGSPHPPLCLVDVDQDLKVAAEGFLQTCRSETPSPAQKRSPSLQGRIRAAVKLQLFP